MKKIIRLSLTSLFILLSAAPVAAANLLDAFKSADNNACSSGSVLDCASGAASYKTGSAALTPEQITSIGITAVLSLLGAIFLILIIYSGIKWMFAGGNEEQVNKARNTINRAIIGLIIVFGAYAISYFILNILLVGTKFGPPGV